MMAQAYFPRQAGGVQTVTKQLADVFGAMGHETAIAAELSFRGGLGIKSAAQLLLKRRRYTRETYDGQLVFRARKIGDKAADIISSFQPDCVVVQSMDALPIARAVSDRGVPLVVCWHDVYLHRMGGDPAGLVATYVANSAFTASVYEAAVGVRSAVIPPMIRRELYETDPAAERGVTFINPVPDKGVDLAIEVASQCPDIPFEFVESWMLEPNAKRRLLDRLAGLPNVRFTAHQTDMRPVYRRARILLAPSRCREGWGRVASEAHVSGIPVVGSRLGGLVESIGPGGLLVEAQAPAATWSEAVRSLWDRPELYDRVAKQARAYSRRPEMDQSWAANRMLAEIRGAIALRAATAMGARSTDRRRVADVGGARSGVRVRPA